MGSGRRGASSSSGRSVTTGGLVWADIALPEASDASSDSMAYLLRSLGVIGAIDVLKIWDQV